jgi:hypothetical protein
MLYFYIYIFFFCNTRLQPKTEVDLDWSYNAENPPYLPSFHSFAKEKNRFHPSQEMVIKTQVNSEPLIKDKLLHFLNLKSSTN